MGVLVHPNLTFMALLSQHIAHVDRESRGRQTTEVDGTVATWDYDEPGVNKGGLDYGLNFPFRMVDWQEPPQEPLKDAVMRHGYEIPLMSAACR